MLATWVYSMVTLLLCFFATSRASMLDDVLATGDECAGEDACTLSVLQRRGMRLQQSHGGLVTVQGEEDLPAWKTSPPDKKEAEILDIIAKAFAAVHGPGKYIESSRKDDQTYEVCGLVDWSVPHVTESRLYKDGEVELGIVSKCKNSNTQDDLCKALGAFTQSMRTLAKKFPEGPKFYNAFVTDWGKYNSWVNGSVGKVSYQTEPPSAKVNDGNGIIEYAICDIVREILTQSPKQYGAGVCSHVASLDALANKAPAKLLEMAVRLLWTGRHSTHEEHSCSYVYERQPGLVPWKNEESQWVPKSAADAMAKQESLCTGNAADCSQAAGQPTQPMGLAFMWAQAAASEIDTGHGGTCKGRKVGMLNYPGISKEDAALIGNDQGGSAASMLWACRHFIDPKGGTCRLHFNRAACGGLPFEVCSKFSTTWLPVLYKESVLKFATEDATLDVIKQTLTGFMAGQSQSSLASLVPKNVNASWNKMWGKDVRGKLASEQILDRMGSGNMYLAMGVLIADTTALDFYDGVPSATEEVLATACSAKVATLLVASDPLQFLEQLGNLPTNYSLTGSFFGANISAADLAIEFKSDATPAMVEQANEILDAVVADTRKPYGMCNHAVFLDVCDEANNEYSLWSWGKLYKVSKELLLGQPVQLEGDESGAYNSGMMCAAITADQISWAERKLSQ
eukprot:TRINITY_DN16063_c0_g1_i2.p1 TRINITY_DN16063_c0_g1~~TRINITY_DN16063_c0_g1_i2.p1  ORF type:complete len:682 (+),score=142.11 TRINITY_DN16063_c0_g1_i2:98-2143(+)